MNRLHIHVSVENLEQAIEFYSAIFASDPTVAKADYAKWMLDDPRVNFAISARGAKPGLDHLGIQVESEAELEAINKRLSDAALPVQEEKGTACCYSESDKYWTVDPVGIPWEAFHTLSSIPVFGQKAETATEVPAPASASACCSPAMGGKCS